MKPENIIKANELLQKRARVILARDLFNKKSGNNKLVIERPGEGFDTPKQKQEVEIPNYSIEILLNNYAYDIDNELKSLGVEIE